MSLCDHPKAELLWRTLQTSGLSWLMEVIPEDVRQEAAMFLLDWPPEVVDADLKKFFRAAQSHFYRVAVNYGFRKPKYARYYVRQAERLEPFEDAEEDSCERRAAIQNWRFQDPEDSLEFRERLELCKRILLSGNGTGKTDWQLFQGYLSGLNLNELAFLTLGEVDLKEVKKRLRKIICRIREAVGVTTDLPMPPMPKKGKVEFRQGRLLGAGLKPDPARWKRIPVPSTLSYKQIMKEYGVNRSTAFRAKHRGWLALNSHNDSTLTEKQPTLA